MHLSQYRTLGRSGLAVSPLALGTMTFGAGRWGVDERDARSIFDAYTGEGGNFIDSADVYSGGESERMIGSFMEEAGNRNALVISTKSGFPRSSSTPLAGGNSARNIRDGIEGSLKRLRTDYVDMYWSHVWDQTTPPEEVLRALTDAVRRGDILYYGFSNAPAWYVTRIATLAQAHGLPLPIGLQYSYSLIDRGLELEVAPAGNAMGMGVVAWGPLGAGLLTGKYGRDKIAHMAPPGTLPNQGGQAKDGGSNGRLNGDNPMGGMLFTEQNFRVVDLLRESAMEIGRPMAQVALSWVVNRPGVSAVLMGASAVEQLRENITSLSIKISPEQSARLDAVGAPPPINPYFIFGLPVKRIHGGHAVEAWQQKPR